MKYLSQLLPNVLYLNQMLSPLKATTDKDKYHGMHFSLITTRSDFLGEFLLFKPFFYNVKLIKGYFINKYFKLPLVGKLGIKRNLGVNQLRRYREVKSIKTNKYIRLYLSLLEKYKKTNVVQDFSEELKVFSQDASSIMIHSKRFIDTFEYLMANPKSIGYYQRIAIIDGNDINNKELLDTLRYLMYIKKDTSFFNLFEEVFIIYPNLNAYSHLSPDIKYKQKFMKLLNRISSTAEISKEEEKHDEDIVSDTDSNLEQKEADANDKVLKTQTEKSLKTEEQIKNEIKDEYLIKTGNLPGEYSKIPQDLEELIDNKFESLKGNEDITEAGKKAPATANKERKVTEELADSIKKSILTDKDVTAKIDEYKELETKERLIQQKIKENLEAENSVVLDFPDFKGKKTTLGEFLTRKRDDVLPATDIHVKNVLNEEVKVSKLKSINSVYQKEKMEEDVVSIFSCLHQDSSNPLFLKKLEKTDVSDAFNRVWLYKATYAETSGKQLTFSVKIPKITNEGYIYLNGEKKFVAKQFLAKPVIKRKPDEVQVTSFYNKTFVQRNGQKSSGLIEKLRKYFDDTKNAKISVIKGNNTKANKDFPTSVLFDDMAKTFSEIKIDNISILFNLKDAEEMAEQRTDGKFSKIFIRYPNAYIFAFDKDRIYFANSNEIYSITDDSLKKHKPDELLFEQQRYSTVIDFILNIIRDTDKVAFDNILKTVTGKRFVYSSARILKRNIPLAILLSFKDGLENFLKRLGIDYTLYPSGKTPREEEKLSYASIRFKDGSLIYYNADFKVQLLMNGLTLMQTNEYNFEDFNTPQPYLDYFDYSFNTRNISKGFRNFWERFIDPVTTELLTKDDIPTDFTGLMIYCSNLLEDNYVKEAVDASNYRIRSTEMITQAFYQVFANAFNQYKTDYANTSGSSAKFTVKDTSVLDRIIESQNVESVTLLSPITEIISQQKCTFKGIGGVNLDDSFTNPYRRYDDSMRGLFSIYTPVSSEAGVNRTLSYNANVVDVRGFIGKKDDEQMSSTEMISTVEGINPFTVQHSDFPRIAMAGTQQAHTTPSIKQSKPLIGSGIHKALAHMIGDDFAFKAKHNGVVEKIDSKTDTIQIKYEDGTIGVIDTKPRLVKNTAGGFYIETQLSASGLKVGKKFKEGDILAFDKNFFKESSDMFGGKDSLEYSSGDLVKLALLTDANTFEDSIIITDDLSEELAFNVVTDKSLVLGPNANIVKMVKIGDHVKSGDPLIVFESSFQEDKINEVLKKLGTDAGQEVIEMGRSIVKSKFTGNIVDIKMFYNHPIEDFSPSIKSIINTYVSSNKKREEIVLKTKTDDILDIANTSPVDYTKLFGQDFDGIFIQIFISHKDTLNQGDKVSAQVALKGTIGNVLKKEEAPLPEYRPDKPVQVCLSPLSVISRMVTDFSSVLYCNKAIIGLKEKCQEIWKS